MSDIPRLVYQQPEWITTHSHFFSKGSLYERKACEFHFHEIYFRFGIYDLSVSYCSIKGMFVEVWPVSVFSVLVGELKTARHRATLQTDFSSLTTHLFYKRQVGTCKQLHPLQKNTHGSSSSPNGWRWLNGCLWRRLLTFTAVWMSQAS